MKTKNKTSIFYILLIGSIMNLTTNCSKDNSVNQNESPTISDYEGNVYHTVTIGNQTWMQENLKSIKLNDGTVIPMVTNNHSWSTLTTMSYTYYGNDSTTYKNNYGALYNWYCVETKKLCPTGWHIPLADDWEKLNSYLGVDSLAGGKLKESSFAHWLNPNLYATNSTGFNALPCGYRFYNGSFNNFGYSGNLWSSSESSAFSAFYRFLTYQDGKLGKNDIEKTYGLSVRCIKD